MNSVRVTAIACLMPLSELDEDPFLVDDRSQHDMCKQWAAARDYHLTCLPACTTCAPITAHCGAMSRTAWSMCS